MDLHLPISKAFSIAAFFGLTFAANGPPESGDEALVAGTSPQPKGGGAAERPPASAAARDRAARDLASDDACPDGMILVDGEHCPDVEQVCLQWLDPPPYQKLRCGEYAKPARCKGAKVHRRFCIDREEYADAASTNDAGDALPVVSKNWKEARALCQARGARLCKEAEWELACEGPEMSPYPYGWKRDSSACNIDRTDLGGPMEKLTDHRAPLTSFPQCTSPYGVHHMVGNVDEWVERERATGHDRSVLRGGWWLPGRNRCRAATIGHGLEYSGKQVGFRCCKDAG